MTIYGTLVVELLTAGLKNGARIVTSFFISVKAEISDPFPASAEFAKVPPMQLATDRLLLRPFALDDAPAVQRLASAYEIAENTLLIPHPYPDGAAAEWIASHPRSPNNHVFAITLQDGGNVAGAIGLEAQPERGRGEIGYWIGVPYWNRGYVTEAARAVLAWGFESLGLHRIFAYHFTRNPASGRVLQKIGMKHEGTMRQHEKKWNEFVDVEVYGILHSEWR